MSVQTSYHDFSGFAQLRAEARQDSAGASKEVAKQFESIFIQIMLKSMRDTVPEGGLFDSSQMTMYQEMYDQQIALDMSHRGGIGLAEMIERQLGGTAAPVEDADRDIDAAPNIGDGVAGLPGSGGSESVANPFAASRGLNPAALAVQRVVDNTVAVNAANVGAADLGKADLGKADPGERVGSAAGLQSSGVGVNRRWTPSGPEGFVEGIRQHAAKAAAELGVSENLLIAQAALETGWGQKIIKHRDGTNSFNLFGIKASEDWPGSKVTRLTLEYRNGVAAKEYARFKAYESPADSFNDYVEFLRGNPRYSDALASNGNDARFARGLQTAGYATDPAYASKILSIKQQLDQMPSVLALKNSDETSLL